MEETMWTETCSRCGKIFEDNFNLLCKMERNYGCGCWISLTLCEDCQKDWLKWYKSVKK